jgi:hypothetical protein
MKTLIDYRTNREEDPEFKDDITILVIESEMHCYYLDQNPQGKIHLFRDENFVKTFPGINGLGNALGCAIIWLQKNIGFSELIIKQ